MSNLKHFITVSLIFMVACVSSPTAVPPTKIAPTTAPATTAMQTYRNDEAGFQIQYPSAWKLTNLPDENNGLMKGVQIQGTEGGIEIQWGTGFGGACPEGYSKIQVAQGELSTCYAKAADGTEMWTQIYKPLPDMTFGARAWTNNAEPASHALVLQVVSTLTFDNW